MRHHRILPINLKHINILKETRLIRHLLGRKANILHSKPVLIPNSPLQIIQNTPSQTANYIDTLTHCHKHCLHVISVITASDRIEENVCFDGFEWLGESEFCDGYTAGGLPGVLHVFEEGDNPIGCFARRNMGQLRVQYSILRRRSRKRRWCWRKWDRA